MEEVGLKGSLYVEGILGFRTSLDRNVGNNVVNKDLEWYIEGRMSQEPPNSGFSVILLEAYLILCMQSGILVQSGLATEFSYNAYPIIKMGDEFKYVIVENWKEATRRRRIR
jgi:hypothetical protein